MVFNGMSAVNVVRIFIQIFATLIALVALGFAFAAIFSTGWQIMIEAGTGEIHQHGLWFDYTRVRPHLAGAPAPQLDILNPNYNSAYTNWGVGYPHETYMGSGYNYGNGLFGQPNYVDDAGMNWIMTYKFGDAVYGDAVHRAQPYQVTALALMVISAILAIVGLLCSYCATLNPCFAISWAAFFFFAMILGAAGLIQFYINAMLPEYRFVFTDRKIQQFIGYSFYWGIVGVVGYGIAMATAIIVGFLIFYIRKRGESLDTTAYTFYRPPKERTAYHVRTMTPV